MLAAALAMALLGQCDEGFDAVTVRLGKPREMRVDWLEWTETDGAPPKLLLWSVDIWGDPICVGCLHDPAAAPFHDGRGWRVSHAASEWLYDEETETVEERYVLWILAPDCYWSTSPRDRLADLIEAEPRVQVRRRVW